MADKKIIAVVGATGSQGGSVVRAVLEDASGEFVARAITRDPESAKARELATLGVEVVRGDIDDEGSLERAFAGAYGAYCVTFFWNHFSPDKEMENAKAMAGAAKSAGVKHVIWSTLEDTREFVPLSDDRMPTLQGNYKVPHFDGKGASNHFFTDAGVPTTFLLTSFFWDNLLQPGGLTRGADGTLAMTLPMGQEPLSGIGTEDIGRSALGIFKRPDLIGKTVAIAGEHITVARMAEVLTKALGQPVKYNEVAPDAFRSFGFPGADDLGNMFQFYRDFADYFTKKRDIAFVKTINPKLQSFEEWVKAHASQISTG